MYQLFNIVRFTVCDSYLSGIKELKRMRQVNYNKFIYINIYKYISYFIKN